VFVAEVAEHAGEVARFERGAVTGAEDVADRRPGLADAAVLFLLPAVVLGQRVEATWGQVHGAVAAPGLGWHLP